MVHVEHNDDYGVVGEDAPDSRILSLLWCNNTDVGNWVLENVDQGAAAVRSSLHVAAEVDSILKHIGNVGFRRDCNLYGKSFLSNDKSNRDCPFRYTLTFLPAYCCGCWVW